MSIYREIESGDKVFGRVRTVSSGLFGDGFELVNFYSDASELDSSISGWVNRTDSDAGENVNPDITPSGEVTNIPNTSGNLGMESFLGLYDPEKTLERNQESWSDVKYGDYYMNVYNEETMVNGQVNSNASSQFTISYGNKNGYGSVNDQKSTSVTKAIYTQYKNILLGPGDSCWTFPVDSSVQSFKDRESIYVINFSSSNLKEKFDAGNLEFRLAFRHGDIVVSETFRDDSRATNYTGSNGTTSGKVCQIVTGSIIDEFVDSNRYATGNGEGSGEGFGFAYPDLGIIVLNPFALACHFGNLIEERQIENGDTEAAASRNNVGRQLAWFGDVDPEKENYTDLLKFGTERNHQNFIKLFNGIKEGGNFKARSTEFVPSKHYFIRVKNTDFNYSNNPSFIFNGNEASELYENGFGPNRDYWLGRMRHEDFVDDPKTYITTVGLYNENNELVAVAKLSVPILKSFDTETLIKVKLDF